MATGKRAFARPSAPETMTAIIRDEPEPLATAAPQTPVPLRWIVERCLAKDREERYASTKDLARDLARLRDGASERQPPREAAAPTGARRSGRRAVLAHRGRRARSSARPSPPSLAKTARGPADLSARELPSRRDRRRSVRAGREDDPLRRRLGGKARRRSIRRASTRPSRPPCPCRAPNLLSISATGKLAILVLHGNDSGRDRRGFAGGRRAPRARRRPTPRRRCSSPDRWRTTLPGEDRLAVVRNGPARVSGRKGPRSRARREPGRRAPVLARRAPDRLHRAPGRGQLGGRRRGPLRKEKDPSPRAGKSSRRSPGPSTRGKSGSPAARRAISIGVVELHAVSLSGQERLVAQNPQLLIVRGHRARRDASSRAATTGPRR